MADGDWYVRSCVVMSLIDGAGGDPLKTANGLCLFAHSLRDSMLRNVIDDSHEVDDFPHIAKAEISTAKRSFSRHDRDSRFPKERLKGRFLHMNRGPGTWANTRRF